MFVYAMEAMTHLLPVGLAGVVNKCWRGGYPINRDPFSLLAFQILGLSGLLRAAEWQVRKN